MPDSGGGRSERDLGREGAVLGDTSRYTWGQTWWAPGEEGKVGGPAGISEIQRSHYPGSVSEERAPCPPRPFPRRPLSSSQLMGECCPCCSASCPSLFRALSEQVRWVSSGLSGCPGSRPPRRSVPAPARAPEHRVPGFLPPWSGQNPAGRANCRFQHQVSDALRGMSPLSFEVT